MRRRTRAFVVAAAAAALAGAIALPASPAGATGTASMSVTPSTNLSDGDTVAVNVTGIPAGTGSSLYLAECNGDASTFADAGSGSCLGLDAASASGGTLSQSVQVKYGRFYDGFPATCDETTACVLALLDFTNNTVVASSPVSFKAVSLGMTVTPDTGLEDGQKIKVTVDFSSVPASLKPLTVAECNTAYMAAHGGYGDGEACSFAGFPSVTSSNPVTLAILEGPSYNEPSISCTHANNGDCAIVLLGTNQYRPVAVHPITFRPLIVGAAATIAASPTTGLHDGTPGTVSLKSGAIADHMSVIYLAECRVDLIAANAGDTRWMDKSCRALSTPDVVGNSMNPSPFQYFEGGVGTTGSKPCDHTHACEIGLVGKTEARHDVRLSNWIPISFRAPNFGTPTLKLSKTRGLATGDRVTMTFTDVPDLVRALNVYECNVKGGYDSERCVFRYSTPGDQGAMIVHDNKAKGSAKVKAGAVGYSKSGKRVYCKASTNGQCVLVAVTYPNSLYRITSPVIKFAP